MPEVDPFPMVEFTWDTREHPGHNLGCAIAGTGVTNDPVTDQINHRPERLFQRGFVVADQHAESE